MNAIQAATILLAGGKVTETPSGLDLQLKDLHFTCGMSYERPEGYWEALVFCGPYTWDCPEDNTIAEGEGESPVEAIANAIGGAMREIPEDEKEDSWE